jgi:excisionase family DNA binding protein
MDLTDVLSELDRLEDAFLAHIQEIRVLRAEIQKHTTNGDLEPLIDAEAVAHILGVEVGHIYALARLRKIPSVMIGKYRKFSPTQLKKWLDRKNAA